MSSESFPPLPQGGRVADARPGPSNSPASPVAFFLSPHKPFEADGGVEVWLLHHVAAYNADALKWLADEVGDVQLDHARAPWRGTVTPR